MFDNLLIGNTKLIIGGKMPQSFYGGISIYIITHKEFNRIHDTIIGDTAFYQVVSFPSITSTTVCHNEFQPFEVITVKFFASEISLYRLQIKLIFADYRRAFSVVCDSS